ncbi:metal-dependent hydrolase [Anaerolineales bacterium]
MGVSINWVGHSTFLLENKGQSVLIDPFINDNPLTDLSADDFSPDVILVTHAHGDHMSDVISIAQRTGAIVACNFEMGNWFLSKGLKNVAQGNPGGTFDGGFMDAKWTIAFHTSSFPDGTYGGQPNGFLIRMAGKTIYHAGDTCLFGDMALIGDEGVDAAILPIGDTYTMGLEDSIKAVNLIQPTYVIPCHYNTFSAITQDVVAWAEMIHRETDAKPIVMDPGGSFICD